MEKFSEKNESTAGSAGQLSAEGIAAPNAAPNAAQGATQGAAPTSAQASSAESPASLTLAQTWKKLYSSEAPAAPRWPYAAGLALLLSFVLLGWQVSVQAEWTVVLNDLLASTIQSLRNDALSAFLFWFCMGPDKSIVYVSTAVIVALLIFCVWRKAWVEFIFIVDNTLLMLVLVLGLKSVYDIARPLHQMIIDVPLGSSFPSGHTGALVMLTFVVGASAILYFRKRGQAWAGWVVFGIFLVYSLIMSASRIYFGVHWGTDIIGSWLVVSSVGVPSLVWFLAKDRAFE